MKLTGFPGFAVAALLGGMSMTSCATAKKPAVCTLESCEAGLAVDIHGDRGGDITVKISASDGQTKSFECDGEATACSSFIPDFTPENVSVTVTKKEGNFIKSYEVVYHNERPNGDDCPPICKQGHIDVTL